MRSQLGDIVLVKRFKYPDGADGSMHNFVVVGINKDEFELVNLDYVCFLISSNMQKSNETNVKFPYNEPIEPTEKSGLKMRSHVKCDFLYTKIKEDDIIMRVGAVTTQQYQKFMKLYAISLGLEEC